MFIIFFSYFVLYRFIYFALNCFFYYLLTNFLHFFIPFNNKNRLGPLSSNRIMKGSCWFFSLLYVASHHVLDFRGASIFFYRLFFVVYTLEWSGGIPISFYDYYDYAKNKWQQKMISSCALTRF